MRIHARTFTATAIVALLLTMLCSGCEKKGPAEQAGEDLDQAAEQVGEKIEELGEDMQDAAQ